MSGINVTHGATGTGAGALVGSATPLPAAVTGVVGVGAAASHEDHVHPFPAAIVLSGTAAAGYVEVKNQSSAPGTPTAAGRIYFDNSNRLSWKGTNTFVRSLDGTANTADRTYTLPDAAGTFVLDTAAQTLTNKTLTQPIVADLSNMTHSHDTNAHGGVLTETAISSASVPRLTRLGIGVAADSVIPLLVQTTKNPNSGGYTSIKVTQTLIQTATADFNNFAFSMSFVDALAVGITNSFTQAAIDAEMQFSASHAGTFGTVIGVLSSTTPFTSAAGFVSNMVGIQQSFSGGATNTLAITNYYGLKIKQPDVGGGTTMTSQYGVLVEDMVVGSSNKYAIKTGRGDIFLMSNAADKFGVWNVTPIVQPTTAFAAATRVGGGGTTVTTTDTFGGYTIAQMANILRSLGFMA